MPANPAVKQRYRFAMLLGALLAVCHGATAQTAAPAPQKSPTAAAEPINKREVDAARLVKLAEQILQKLDRTRRDELSLEVLRDAEEVERLAKSLKAETR